MSLSQFQNDRQLALDASVEDQRRRPVYRFRIEIHNLRDGELEQRDSKSENHATIALLLGRSQSVRIDMISDPMTFLGRMDVRARGDIVSRRTIRMTDINATGCPNSFDPDGMPPLSQHSRTVEDVLTFLLVNRLNRYRFMYIDSQPLGCRYWVPRVMLGMQRFGFLRADANFSQGLEGLMPLQMLLACQWDVRMDANAGIPTPVVPGLFLQGREASTTATTNEILQKLLHAGIPALQRLANVLDCRSEARALFQRVGIRRKRFRADRACAPGALIRVFSAILSAP